MSRLVLSLFSGVGALDEGFRRAGFCVVSAGDLAWSSLYDVRAFYPPADVFDGVIGGDPCQSHSALANLVRAKGLTPSFPDLTPEVERVIAEARPRWFLRENVPKAPDLEPEGYGVETFLLDHSTLDSGDGTGHEQRRLRRFWFGLRSDLGEVPELRAHLRFALHVLPDEARAVCVDVGHDKLDGAEKIRARRDIPVGHGFTPSQRERRRRQVVTHRADPVPVALGGSGKLKATRAAVTARHHGAIGTTGGHAGNPPRYTLDEMLELQGLPKELFEWSPLTMQGKRKLVGNAVPLPMAEALARAVRDALEAA